MLSINMSMLYMIICYTYLTDGAYPKCFYKKKLAKCVLFEYYNENDFKFVCIFIL